MDGLLNLITQKSQFPATYTKTSSVTLVNNSGSDLAGNVEALEHLLHQNLDYI